MKIQMPKACISCVNYTGQGYKHDDQNPIPGTFGQRATRAQYGTCSAHCKDVFCTEICGSYEADDLIDVVPVENRSEPMQPHQELLTI